MQPARPAPLCSRPPPVVLSDDLVRDPEGMLRALCAALSLPFDPAMLSWPAGPKPYDGPWAPWWYGQTHKSTGGWSAACTAPSRLALGAAYPGLLLRKECIAAFLQLIGRCPAWEHALDIWHT